MSKQMQEPKHTLRSVGCFLLAESVASSQLVLEVGFPIRDILNSYSRHREMQAYWET